LRPEAPRKVTAKKKNFSKKAVTVSVAWQERTAVGCPMCGKACGVHDQLPDRTWQYLSVTQ
jgi:hypothetical protein